MLHCLGEQSGIVALAPREHACRGRVNPEVQSGRRRVLRREEHNIPTCGQPGRVVADQGKFAELKKRFQAALEARRRVLGSADLKAKLARD
jgi:hypothetical protein